MFHALDVVVPPEYTQPVTEGTSPVTSDGLAAEAGRNPTMLIMLLVLALLVTVCVVGVCVVKKNAAKKNLCEASAEEPKET